MGTSRSLLFVILLACLVGCVEALSPQDVASLRDSQTINLHIYGEAESGGIRALARASYCSTEAVLKRSDAGTVDSNGTIKCGDSK